MSVESRLFTLINRVYWIRCEVIYPIRPIRSPVCSQDVVRGVAPTPTEENDAKTLVTLDSCAGDCRCSDSEKMWGMRCYRKLTAI